MPDVANFNYEGNAVLNISGGSVKCESKVGDIEILSVQHLIPIKVALKVNGAETVVGAYIDYTDKSVTVPSNELVAVDVTQEAFAQAVQQHLSDKIERQMAEAEAQQAHMARENYRHAKIAQARAYAEEHMTIGSE